jgi:hypothetical protein
VSENQMNCSKKSTNKSGVLGVHWCESRDKFRVQIKLNGKKKHIGYYCEIEDATRARRRAAKKYFGEYANLDAT